LTFTGWSGAASTSNPLQITMNAPLTITAAFDIPGATCTMTGDTAASIADVQFIVNQALGVIPANNDLNNDGVVNIADIQKVLNSALRRRERISWTFRPNRLLTRAARHAHLTEPRP
jgi:hypothetical protein